MGEWLPSTNSDAGDEVTVTDASQDGLIADILPMLEPDGAQRDQCMEDTNFGPSLDVEAPPPAYWEESPTDLVLGEKSHLLPDSLYGRCHV